MAIAAQRISRFVGWTKRSIVGLIRGFFGLIIRIIRCQPAKRQDVALEMTEEKDFQVRRPFTDREGAGGNNEGLIPCFLLSLSICRVKTVI